MIDSFEVARHNNVQRAIIMVLLSLSLSSSIDTESNINI